MKHLIQLLVLIITLTYMSLNANAGEINNVKINVGKSVLKWKGTKKIGKGHWGNISFKSAKVEKKGKEISRIEFIVDMNSFTVDNLEGDWKKKFTGHMKSGDFFDVAEFPTSRLILDKRVTEDTFSGTLTIKGKSNPVKIKFNRIGKHFSGKLAFNRTDYGIIYGSGNFFKKLVADKVINDLVELEFDIVIQ